MMHTAILVGRKIQERPADDFNINSGVIITAEKSIYMYFSYFFYIFLKFLFEVDIHVCVV